MAKVGRPRALDEFKRREVCALVSVGCGIEAAARYVGCNPSTIRREALRNPEFHDQLRHAELAAELEPLQAMKRAAATHWRAAAWLLERTHPERFGRRDAKSLRPDQLDAMMVRLAEDIARELPDPQTCERVYRRIVASMHTAEREAWAADHTRRDRRRRGPSALTPPLSHRAREQRPTVERPSPDPLPRGEVALMPAECAHCNPPPQGERAMSSA